MTQPQGIPPVMNVPFGYGQQPYQYNPYYNQNQVNPGYYTQPVPVQEGQQPQQTQSPQYLPGTQPFYGYVPVPQGYVAPQQQPYNPQPAYGPIGQHGPSVPTQGPAPGGQNAGIVDPAHFTRQYAQQQNEKKQQ